MRHALVAQKEARLALVLPAAPYKLQPLTLGAPPLPALVNLKPTLAPLRLVVVRV